MAKMTGSHFDHVRQPVAQSECHPLAPCSILKMGIRDGFPRIVGTPPDRRQSRPRAALWSSGRTRRGVTVDPERFELVRERVHAAQPSVAEGRGDVVFTLR